MARTIESGETTSAASRRGGRFPNQIAAARVRRAFGRSFCPGETTSARRVLASHFWPAAYEAPHPTLSLKKQFFGVASGPSGVKLTPIQECSKSDFGMAQFSRIAIIEIYRSVPARS
jgi:hypothetical protein